MLKLNTTFLLIVMSTLSALSKDEDLKKIYTTVTNSIHSAILTKKGNFEVSGSAFYDNLKTTYKSDTETAEQKTFQAEPVVAYFLLDNLSLGPCFSYTYQNINNQSSEQKMIGAICKKYFGSDQWRPFLMVDYLFLMGDSFDGREADFGAGILYHVAGNFGISTTVKYGLFQSKDNIIEKQNRFYVGMGIVNYIF